MGEIFGKQISSIRKFCNFIARCLLLDIRSNVSKEYCCQDYLHIFYYIACV